MKKFIRWALIANALGFTLAVPCLVETTPTTMAMFFMVGLPAFGIGLLLYVATVFRDLRKHQVL